MRLNLDLYKFLERMLPVHKRQTNRLKLFYWPFKSLHRLYTVFNEWRTDAFFRANITGQTMSLQAYLNRYIDGANNGIVIIEEEDSGTWCGLESENADHMKLGIEASEPEDYIYLAINGEAGTSLPVDFRVIAPSTTNAEQIQHEVKKYKIAGVSFDVKTN